MQLTMQQQPAAYRQRLASDHENIITSNCNDNKTVLVDLLEAAVLAIYMPLAKAMMRSCYAKANCINAALQTTYNIRNAVVLHV